MEIQRSTRHGCAVVAFSGTIDLASVATVQRTLLKGLSEQPDALICDLTGVQHLDPVVATVFSTVARHPASRWPTTSFLLCGARPQVAEALRRVRVSQLARMYATVEEAVEAARARQPMLRDELRLAPVPSAARAARAFVREVCRAWRLDAPDATVVDRAVLVANELVTNAVLHAHTDLWLRLELRADRLFITVRDRGPKLLQPVPSAPEDEGGRGLWLVEQLGRAWGVRPAPGGGKTVWCSLTL
jgi:anti-anti-sigma regulatory factor/anti-sigma regulatory factor (Ser/Thr protein kinase)